MLIFKIHNVWSVDRKSRSTLSSYIIEVLTNARAPPWIRTPNAQRTKNKRHQFKPFNADFVFDWSFAIIFAYVFKSSYVYRCTYGDRFLLQPPPYHDIMPHTASRINTPPWTSFYSVTIIYSLLRFSFCQSKWSFNVANATFSGSVWNERGNWEVKHFDLLKTKHQFYFK